MSSSSNVVVIIVSSSEESRKREPQGKPGRSEPSDGRCCCGGCLGLAWNTGGVVGDDGLVRDLRTLHLAVCLRHGGVLLLEGEVIGDALLDLLEALGELLPVSEKKRNG